jgi:hypothetical protein
VCPKKVPTRAAFPKRSLMKEATRYFLELGSGRPWTKSRHDKVCLRASVTHSEWNDREAKRNAKAQRHTSRSSPDVEGIPDAYRKSKSIFARVPRNTQSLRKWASPCGDG